MAYQNPIQFMGTGDKSFQQWLANIWQKPGIWDPSQYGYIQNKYSPPYLMNPQIGLMGTASLANILESQGRTDPRLMNQQIAQMQRDTQVAQGNATSEMARRGLMGSGVGSALQAAIGQAGAERISGRQAEEAQLAEQRKREDLDLLLRMFIQPQIDYQAIGQGAYQQGKNRQVEQRGQTLGFWGNVLGGLGRMWGCWVADALFGEGSDDAMAARYWMNAMAPREIREAYLRVGPELADRVKAEPAFADSIRPAFVTFSRLGKEALGVK